MVLVLKSKEKLCKQNSAPYPIACILCIMISMLDLIFEIENFKISLRTHASIIFKSNSAIKDYVESFYALYCLIVHDKKLFDSNMPIVMHELKS